MQPWPASLLLNCVSVLPLSDACWPWATGACAGAVRNVAAQTGNVYWGSTLESTGGEQHDSMASAITHVRFAC